MFSHTVENKVFLVTRLGPCAPPYDENGAAHTGQQVLPNLDSHFPCAVRSGGRGAGKKKKKKKKKKKMMMMIREI